MGTTINKSETQEELLLKFVDYLKWLNKDVYYDDVENFLEKINGNNSQNRRVKNKLKYSKTN